MTGKWFTANVPEDTGRDLLFQDALCLKMEGKIVSFIIFTSWDGSIHITLMGIHPGYQWQGLGSVLMERFLRHVKVMGFDRIVVFTVPPDVKPVYAATVKFYEKHEFVIKKRYRELWEDGAIELVKTFN